MNNSIDVSKVQLKEVQALAVISNKYQCQNALRFITPTIMEPLLRKADLVECRHLVAASYLLNCSNTFAAATKRLILEETETFSLFEPKYALPGCTAGMYLDALFPI